MRIKRQQKRYVKVPLSSVLIQKKATGYSVIIFAFGLLLISIISLNLYKAISSPLKKIEKAAKILGQGNLDYKIDIKSRNEFTHIVVFAHRGKGLFNYNDPVIIDGAANQFNVIKAEYKYRKLV